MGLNIKKIGPNKYFLDVRVRAISGRLRERETFLGTKQEAEERFLQLREELKAGKTLICALKTFADVLNLYKEKRLTLPGKEISIYARLMRDLGAIDLKSISQRLDAYIMLLRRSSSKRTGKPLSNGSINRLLTFIRAAFNLAVSLEYLEKSPISKARFPRLKETPRDTILSPLALENLFNAMEKYAPHLISITQYALQVPSRKSELINMRCEDLDMFHHAIRVRNGTTKNNDGIWKPIPPNMLSYFRSIPAGSTFIFFREEKGEFFPLGDFKKAWATCLKHADIKDFHFHDTRHMSATDLVNNGTPEQTVMQIAGWRSNMLRNYFHRDGKVALSLVKFSPGWVHSGYTFDDQGEKAEVNQKLR